MDTSGAISVNKLKKSFETIDAIDQLSFEVLPGELYIIVGPDGAGKTTLLRTIAGIMPFDNGDVSILGHSLPDQAEKIKLKLGYMPQRFGLYEDLSVQENLGFFYSLYCLPRKKRNEIFARMYEFSGLERFKRRLAGKLSGGMKQKLGLACALLHQPELLLLDEPTNGVDPYSRRIFWQILSDFKKQGVTIVVATPFMDEAERGDRVLLINEGKKLAEGTPEEIKSLWQGELYEIHSSDSRSARQFLSETGMTRSSELFGNKVHFVPAEDSDINTIKQKLEEKDLISSGPDKIEPELEDLFIFLVKHAR